MASIGSLTATLSLESAAFIRDLSKAAGAVATSTESMNRRMAAFGKEMNNAFRITAITLVVREIAHFVDEMLAAAQQTDQMAHAVGLSTDQFQAFSVAAMNAGVSADQVNSGMQIFARTIGDVRLQQGRLYTTLKTLSPAFLEQLRSAKNMGEAFDIFFAGLAKIPGAAERADVALAAFGRNNIKIVNIIEGGAVSLADLQKRFAALIIPPELVEEAEQLRNSWELTKRALEVGFTTAFLESFTGELDTSTKGLEKMNRAGRLLGSSLSGAFRLAIDVLNEMPGLIEYVAGAFSRMDQRVRDFQASQQANMMNPKGDWIGLQGPGGGKNIPIPKNVPAVSLKGTPADPATWITTVHTATDATDDFGAALGKVDEANAKLVAAFDQTTAENNKLIDATHGSISAFVTMKETLDATADALKHNIDPASAMGEAYIKAAVAAKESARELAAAEEKMNAIPNLINDSADAMRGAFVDAIADGKDLHEVLQDLSKDLEKLLLNFAFKQLIGQVGTTQAAGSGLLGMLMHTGGIVGQGGPMRSLPAETFAHAPRFHSGLFPGEMPAILQRGEGVFTKNQMSSMRGGQPISVNVTNRSDAEVTGSGKSGPNGIDINLIVDQANAKNLGKPGSASAKTMRSLFGARPPLTRT